VGGLVAGMKVKRYRRKLFLTTVKTMSKQKKLSRRARGNFLISTQEKFIPVIDISSVTLKLSLVFRYRNCNTSAMYGSILSVINQEENPSCDRKRTFCTNDH
jgi:hypothetical protein